LKQAGGGLADVQVTGCVCLGLFAYGLGFQGASVYPLLRLGRPEEGDAAPTHETCHEMGGAYQGCVSCVMHIDGGDDVLHCVVPCVMQSDTVRHGRAGGALRGQECVALLSAAYRRHWT
jgi:hypothetical protein